MRLNFTSTPRLYKNIYKDWVEGFLLVYNPFSNKGLSVLNKEAAFLFSLIDNKKTLNDILELGRKKDPELKFAHLIPIFKDFLTSEIIYFESSRPIRVQKFNQLGVWLHITNQCNLRCTYCYVRKTNEKMTPAIAYKAIKKVFLSAKKHGFEKISFKFSGGEALLEINKILDIVQKIKIFEKKYQIKSDFVVLTNGVLLTKKIARILKENDLRVSLSLDGLAKYHDQTRIFPNGEGSFRYVQKAIENLQKSKVLFNVSVTITSKNVEGIPELTKYLLERNILFVFNFYRENPYVKEELKGDDKKLVEYLKKAYHFIYQTPPFYSLINGLLDRVYFKRAHLHTCGMGNNYLVIRHDGQVVSCQNLLTLQKPIGSIDDEDLMEIIKEGNFVRPRGLTVEGKDFCKDCQWKYVCCGGCPLLTFDQKGRYDTSSPYCAVYKTLIPEVLRLEAKRLIKYGFNKENFNKEEPIIS